MSVYRRPYRARPQRRWVGTRPAAATLYNVTATDTGATIGDTVALTQTRPITDTGSTVSDSVATVRTRIITDTGSTIGDTIATTRLRSVTDTGATITDTATPRTTRTISDTGVTITDSVATLRQRSVTDTGVTLSDSLVTIRARPPTDTGATITDAVILTTGRIITDTGSTITDSVSTSRTRVVTDTGSVITDIISSTRVRGVTDTGAAITDSVVPNIARGISDAGTTISDTVATIRSRVILDTGTSITDAITVSDTRLIADVGTTVSDAVALTQNRSITDTGASISDALSITITRLVSDTGSTITDTLTVTTRRPIVDTGATITDTIQPTTTRIVTDTGAVILDTVAIPASRSITDTGTTISDSVATTRTRVIADTGATITDSITATRTRIVTDNAFTFADTFSNTASSTWAAVQGLAWTVTSGAASAFSEAGGAGTITAPAGTGGSVAIAHIPVAGVDGDRSIDFDWNSDPVGAAQQVRFYFRMQSNSDEQNGYRLTVNKNPATPATMTVQKLVAGNPTNLFGGAINVPGDIIAATRYRIHIRISGSTISASVYPVGTTEPNFQISGSDSTYPTGTSIAIGAQWVSSNTNRPIFDFDNLSVPTAQSDTIQPATTRAITDTGATITDAVTSTAARSRAITDTGATISDSVALLAVRSIADNAFTLSDAFSGSATGGWATIQGLAWTNTAGSAANLSEAAGVGTITAPGGTGGSTSVVHLPVAGVDGDRYVDFSWNSDPVGAAQQVRFYFRLQSNADEQNGYRVTINKNPGAAATISLAKIVAGAVTTFGATVNVPGDIIAATRYRIHAHEVGSSLGVNVYPVGTTEPAGYQASATDSTYPTGVSVALSAQWVSGNTNRPIFNFDNLSIPISMSDIVQLAVARTATDTGATITDTVTRTINPTRAITDTGTTITATLTRSLVATRSITDTGTTITDAVQPFHVRVFHITDIGTHIDDSARRFVNRHRVITDTGTTITDIVGTGSVTYTRVITDWAFSGMTPPLTPPFVLTGGMSDTVHAFVSTAGHITTGGTSTTPLTGASGVSGGSGTTSTTGRTGLTSVTLRSVGPSDVSPISISTIVTNTRTSGKTDLSPLTGETEALA